MRALIGLLAASTLLAGSFRVSPVRIDLSAHKPHTTVQVTNIGADRVTLQVDAYSWHFAEGEDRLVDSDDILVNPPVFTLEPGASQVLRLGLREYTPANAETPYRVILEEVPPPQRSGVNGIVTLLRVSIPLFVQSSQRGTSDLVWSCRPADRRTHGAHRRESRDATCQAFSIPSACGRKNSFLRLDANLRSSWNTARLDYRWNAGPAFRRTTYTGKNRREGSQCHGYGWRALGQSFWRSRPS